MNYKNLSDFEINKLVAEREGWKIVNKNPTPNKGLLVVASQDQCRAIDYCNSWEGMGPIIQREKITVDAPFEKYKNWQASFWCYKEKTFKFESDHKNPLRAAAIVYLMMGV